MRFGVVCGVTWLQDLNMQLKQLQCGCTQNQGQQLCHGRTGRLRAHSISGSEMLALYQLRLLTVSLNYDTFVLFGTMNVSGLVVFRGGP